MSSLKRISELVFAGPATPEQLTEYKEIFLKSVFDSSALQPSDDWITFTNQNGQYQLTISPQKDLHHTWYARRIDPLYIRYASLAEYNKQVEKMFAEKSFYGIKDADGLHSLVNQVKQGGFGVDYFYPSILRMVAYYWYTIATKQMFNNGNKRTAFVVALAFLKNNGYSLNDLTTDDLYQISMNLARSEMSYEDLFAFLQQRARINLNWNNETLRKE